MNNYYSIEYQGLSLGSHHFSFDLRSDLFAAYPQSEIEKADGAVEIEMLKHSNFMELEVSINGVVDLQCDRCTDTYSQPIDFADQLMVKIGQAADNDEQQGEVMWVDGSQKLDLAQWIYESVILSLPVQRVHPNRDDCNKEVLKYIS